MGTDVEILTIDEVAAWLRISKRAVYEMTSERGRARMKHHPLPVLRINSSIRFVKSDVAQWIEKLASDGK
jgi:excisionase family DNA binding protein